MRQRTWAIVLAGLALGACTETVDGLSPVGGDEASEVEQRRFLRRLHLDLAGSVPDEPTVATDLDMLSSEGNSATTRAQLADALLATEPFSVQFVSEVENAVYGGERIEDRYGLLCGIIRNDNPACQSCTSSDPCDCACAPLADIYSDRQGLYDAVDDMMAGASTSTIERRYAMSRAFRDLSAPQTVVAELFEQFLGRPAEADEVANASAMIFGVLLEPTAPAGLLFHRHGSNYNDLIDIIFSSEIYREAMVSRVFQRYLGRRPSAEELAHFTPQADAADPDLRPIIRAVTSSREYFEQ